MKRSFVIALCLALAACSTEPAESEGTSGQEIASGGFATEQSTHPSGTFTNMGDEDSLAEVTATLAAAGVPNKDIDSFAAQVRSFTQVVPAGTLVTDSIPLEEQVPDHGKTSEATSSQDRLTNCRITTFTLAHSLITVGKPEGAEPSMLFIDLEQVEAEPPLFEDTRPSFEALYGRIPTTREKDMEQRTADISQYLVDHAISFADSKASIVSVFIHDTLDPQAYSFIGHTGVLVDTPTGLLFIEKLAFDAPYRAIWFDNRSQLNEYLMSMYDDGPEQDYGQPIIFENGSPLPV
ncbi:DUF4300 family protein [Corynebacterium auriscanis]|uniref:DUF4300 family protein n=1 Tax=Corynebacterium auriscanis TaxID=99807 RepID=UPI003CF5DC74